MRDDKGFRKHTYYAVINYMDAGYDSINLWAEISDLNPTTINGCKCYHRHLNAESYSAQPCIYLFVESLLRKRTST